LAYRSQVVGNAAVCGHSAMNRDERLLTHSPNSHYVPIAAAQAAKGSMAGV